MNAEAQRAYRDRLRGGPPREPQPCGTYAAARRHERKGEHLDAACRRALLAYQQARRTKPTTTKET